MFNATIKMFVATLVRLYYLNYKLILQMISPFIFLEKQNLQTFLGKIKGSKNMLKYILTLGMLLWYSSFSFLCVKIWHVIVREI